MAFLQNSCFDQECSQDFVNKSAEAGGQALLIFFSKVSLDSAHIVFRMLRIFLKKIQKYNWGELSLGGRAPCFLAALIVLRKIIEKKHITLFPTSFTRPTYV